MISEERLREMWGHECGLSFTPRFERFARAVEAEAYKAAAKVCERNAILYPSLGTGWESSMECAAAIRSLITKE